MIDTRSVRALARAALDEILSRLEGVPMPDPADRRCAAPGCSRRVTAGYLCDRGDVGRPGAPGYTGDGGHVAQLGTWLRDVEAAAGQLDPSPSLAACWNYATGGSTGGGEPAFTRAPARLDPLVLSDPRHGTGRSEDDVDLKAGGSTASVLAVLHSYADEVRTGRTLARPVRTVRIRVGAGPACDGECEHDSCQQMWFTDTVAADPTIAGERDLLTRQLRWIAEQEWAGDFYRDIRDLRAQLLRANGDTDEKPLTGWCYRQVDDQGSECRGRLWPDKPAHTSGSGDDEDDGGGDDGPARPRAVVCDRNPTHRWTGADLARLALILERQQREDTAAPPPESAPTSAHPRPRLAVIAEQQRRESVS